MKQTLNLLSVIPLRITPILLCLLTSAYAQYTEKWHSQGSLPNRYIGCKNTDSDNNEEVVTFQYSFYNYENRICVIDGISGAAEWTLDPPWFWISEGGSFGNEPRLVDVNNDGRHEILFYGKPTDSDSSRWYLYEYSGSRINEGQKQPDVYQEVFLGQNVPNPTTSITTIKYSLTQKGKVELRIYNSIGRLVRTLSEGTKNAGAHTINWDSRDDDGTKLPSGSYFYQLEIDNQKKSKKLVIVK